MLDDEEAGNLVYLQRLGQGGAAVVVQDGDQVVVAPARQLNAVDHYNGATNT